MSIAEMLDSEIERTLKELSTAQNGSEAAKGALIKLSRLHEERMKELEVQCKNRQATDASLAKMDEFRIREAELDAKIKQADAELEIQKQELLRKDAELAEAKKARRWHTLMEALGIALPVGVSAWWMGKSLRFEEEGKIFSSRASQWVSNFTRLFRKG